MDFKHNEPELPGFDDFIKKNARRVPEKDRLVEDFLKFVEVVQDDMPEEEKIPVDTYGCDCMFVRGFMNEDLLDDFPLVIRDFMEHEAANIDKYDMVDYFKVDDGTCWPEKFFVGYGLNLMYNAYLGGSEYARKLFICLYKTYFRKEYRHLKKFSKIGAQDILKPKKAELVVDEMLAICSDVVRWKSKKELERANAKYNEVLYFGLENLPDDE